VLFGRSAEREAITALLERARLSEGGALVLRGEPGIGKTALLEDSREAAGDMQVLAAGGIESESDLPFAALHQLLRPALGYIGELPTHQADAVRTALGLSQGEAKERFLVAAGCLSLLSEMSAENPVLCLVDDAQWLDSATSDALLFVARRLAVERIVILFAAREGDERGFEAPGLPSLAVSGLDRDAAAMLLEHGAGTILSKALVERLVDETNGNALALLEVPSALSPQQLSGDEPLPRALPMTNRLEAIFLRRVRRLPTDTQTLLLVMAADESEDIALALGTAKRLGSDETALDAAEQSQLISIDGMRFVFRHPLVRSAVYEAATSRERRAVHRALAAQLGETSKDIDLRAWHLASSALEPDETVAAEVEELAIRAEARAGHAAASRALERAAELSPESGERARRLAMAAKAASVAGADDTAVKIAREASNLTSTPEQAAEVATALALAELRRGRPRDGFPILVEAARNVSATNPGKALELCMHAMWSASQSGFLAGQREAAQLAANLLPPRDDERAAIFASFLAGFAAVADGDAARAASALAPGVRLASTVQDASTALTASMGALLVGDDETYETLLIQAISLARAGGELGTLVWALSQRSAQLLMLQRFSEAAIAADEAIELSIELRADNHVLVPRAVLAAVDALRGRADDAQRSANEVLSIAEARGLTWRTVLAHLALGWVEMGRGRWVNALAHFDAASRTNAASAPRVAFEQVESAVHAGNFDHARTVTAWFESWTEQTNRAWARPRLACCKGLVSSGAEATQHYEHALAQADGSRLFDRARIHLLFGEHLRRERRRVDAREQLKAAIDGFERLQAEPWAERAHAGLRASGESVRKRDPSAVDELTSQELRISELVAAGLSNKEVAAQLFLSPRTIDAHLRSIFAKLGVTSRTQLAQHLADPSPATVETRSPSLAS
jgi:DNA-binding CsgD family transcriptional regulator